MGFEGEGEAAVASGGAFEGDHAVDFVERAGEGVNVADGFSGGAKLGAGILPAGGIGEHFGGQGEAGKAEHGGGEAGVFGWVAGVGEGEIDGRDTRRGGGENFESGSESAAEAADAAMVHEGAVVEGEQDGFMRAVSGGVDAEKPVIDVVVELGGERGEREGGRGESGAEGEQGVVGAVGEPWGHSVLRSTAGPRGGGWRFRGRCGGWCRGGGRRGI